MSATKTTTRVIYHELATKRIQSTVATLRHKMGVPLSVVRQVLAEATGIAAAIDPNSAALDFAIATVREAAIRTRQLRGNEHGADQDSYNIAFDVFTAATEFAGHHGVSKTELLPPLLDFAAAVSLILAGEQGLAASVQRMTGRIQDWHNGVFLVRDDAADMSANRMSVRPK